MLGERRGKADGKKQERSITMAKSIDDSIRGRVGKVIHSSWRGRPYVLACPETVSNPKTEAQQAHRNAFVALSRLASYMKEGHKVGLQYISQAG